MFTADKVLNEGQLKKFFSKLKSEKEKSVLVIKGRPNLSNPKESRVIMDFFIFSLIANTGLRISEVLNLKVSDVRDDYIFINKDISKNGKIGTVYFGKNTRNLINEYIKFRFSCFNKFSTEILFPSKSSRKRILSRSYLHTRFKYWLDLSGLPNNFSIHSLRHTYGTTCLDKGLSLTFVRDQLRHSSISTTSKYLHLTKKNREKVKDIF